MHKHARVGGSHHDEVFDDAGRERKQYADLFRRTGWDPLRPGARLAARLWDRPLGDDARILGVPLVLDDVEYEKVIRAGLVQRAVALQDLFADLVLGCGSVLRAGLGLTGDLLDSLLAGEATSLALLRRRWRGHGPESIRFVYGPDLVRGPQGRWTVLEDNVGCVGGSADSSFVADFCRAAAGSPCDPSRHRADLSVAVSHWLKTLDAAPGEVRAVLGCDATGIHENARRRLLLGRLGIAVGRLPGPVATAAGGRFPNPNPVAGGRPTGPAETAACFTVAQELGTRRPPPRDGRRLRAVVNFAVDERSAQAFTRARMPLFNAPGTGFLGNKALLPFIDGIIRFFTGREPILPTPQTVLLGGGLPAEPDDWVVKSATGCQGTEVVVVRDRPPAAVAKLLRAQSSPTAMVAQRFVPLSRLCGYLTEIRPVTYVLGHHDVRVSRQPLGRAAAPGRLTNLSQGAAYLCVLREPCCAIPSI